MELRLHLGVPQPHYRMHQPDAALSRQTPRHKLGLVVPARDVAKRVQRNTNQSLCRGEHRADALLREQPICEKFRECPSVVVFDLVYQVLQWIGKNSKPEHANEWMKAFVKTARARGVVPCKGQRAVLARGRDLKLDELS
jgi:hypothetical protein